MQLKKLLQGSAFALVAAACAIAVPSVVKAADVTGTTTDSGVGTVAVDGEKAQLTVSSATDKEVLVGFAKVNGKGKVTVPTWDTYDGTSATVDLSKLSNVKDNYIALTTPSKLAKDAITIVKIPATKKVFKAEFDASTGVMKVGEADKGKPEMKELTTTAADATAGSKFQYRTAYSSWADMGDASKLADYSLYQEEGATLFVRKKGVKETAFPTSQADGTYTFGANDKLKAYETTSSLPGKEAKVAIKARAKGPSVSGDYTKGTIKLPKNAEYRLCSSAALESADASSKKYNEVGSAAKTMTIAEITTGKTTVVTATTTEFDVEVRTAADTTKKKAASKWSRLTVSVPKKLSEASPSLLTKKDTWDTNKANGVVPAQDTTEHKNAATDTGIKGAVVKEDSTVATSVLAVDYVTKGRLDATKFFTANAVQIKNNGAKTYEIVTTANKDTAPAADAKATKVAPGKTVTLTKVADGAGVYIRVAGDKKTKTWVGAYDLMGIVDYPFTVPAKAAQGN